MYFKYYLTYIVANVFEIRNTEKYRIFKTKYMLIAPLLSTPQTYMSPCARILVTRTSRTLIAKFLILLYIVNFRQNLS